MSTQLRVVAGAGSNPLQLAVPNVNFSVYAPGFFARFLESHAVMLQGNAGLKPKEGEITSRPWQWPINYRVSLAGCTPCWPAN